MHSMYDLRMLRQMFEAQWLRSKHVKLIERKGAIWREKLPRAVFSSHFLNIISMEMENDMIIIEMEEENKKNMWYDLVNWLTRVQL